MSNEELHATIEDGIRAARELHHGASVTVKGLKFTVQTNGAFSIHNGAQQTVGTFVHFQNATTRDEMIARLAGELCANA